LPFAAPPSAFVSAALQPRTMWAAFAYLVIPLGAAVTVMLVSGFKLLVDFASFFLNSPIRIQKVQISVALFMTGICAIMGLLSYSSWQRAEHMLEQGRKQFAIQMGLEDQLMRNVFMQARNYWMSMLGLTLWGVAWRLKTLFDSKTLVLGSTLSARTPRSPQSRAIYIGVALLCAGLADVPLCRLNYSLQLATFITPKKTELMEFSRRHSCSQLFVASAQGECAKFCSETKKLADDRLWAINWARDWHVFGKLAAQAFDGFRSVEQGQSRIEKLFVERTCEKVLSSTDKSNSMVNMACAVLAGISIMGCLIAIQNVLSDSAPGDIPEATAVGLAYPVLGQSQPADTSMPVDATKSQAKPTARNKENVTD